MNFQVDESVCVCVSKVAEEEIRKRFNEITCKCDGTGRSAPTFLGGRKIGWFTGSASPFFISAFVIKVEITKRSIIVQMHLFIYFRLVLVVYFFEQTSTVRNVCFWHTVYTESADRSSSLTSRSSSIDFTATSFDRWTSVSSWPPASSSRRPAPKNAG